MPLVLPCNPPHFPSILKFFCLFDKNPAIFEDLNTIQHLTVLCCAPLLRFATVHQFWSQSLFRVSRAFPAPNGYFTLSSYQIVAPPKCRFLHFPKFVDKYFGPTHFPWHLQKLTTPSTLHASILVGLSTPLGSMFRSGHEIRLPKRCEENASAAGQNSLLKEVGSEARV